MKSPVFARVRSEVVAAVLVAAGSSSLVACSSSEANYRPAPNYTQPAARTAAPAQRSCGAGKPAYVAPSQPVYVQPTQPQPQVAAPVAPAPSKGQFACGKGKCG
jgi:hypothetical protein